MYDLPAVPLDHLLHISVFCLWLIVNCNIAYCSNEQGCASSGQSMCKQTDLPQHSLCGFTFVPPPPRTAWAGSAGWIC